MAATTATGAAETAAAVLKDGAVISSVKGDCGEHLSLLCPAIFLWLLLLLLLLPVHTRAQLWS